MSDTCQTPSQKVEPEDFSLIEGVARGDEGALFSLISRYNSRLRSVAQRYLPPFASEKDIEEILSDTFAEAWFTAQEFKPERGSLGTWLAWIVIGKASPRRRALIREAIIGRTLLQSTRSESEPGGQSSGGIEEVDAKLLLFPALEALRQAAPRDAEILIRRYLKDQSPGEIAQDLGISPNLARVRLHRALVSMKRLLGQAGVGDERR